MKDPTYYTGAPGPEHDPGRSTGKAERYVCLECDWQGRGTLAYAEHFYQFGHRTRWIGPRHYRKKKDQPVTP